MNETKFKLPTRIIPQKETDAHDLIITSIPKVGKTVITAGLTQQLEGKAILLGLENGGTDYVQGVYINVWEDPEDPKKRLSFEQALHNYKSWRDTLLKNKGVYEYLIIDTMSALYDFATVFGTYFYMFSIPAGKNFNRDKSTGKEYTFGDENFKLVTTLPDGNGYQYVYKWFLDQMLIFSEIAPYRIYLAHVKDKLLKNNNNVEEVKGSEINLTGKLKDMVASRVATLCKLIADGNKRYLSFEVDDSNIIAGSRVSRLEGKILISEKTKGGEIKTYWENIYENLKKK